MSAKLATIVGDATKPANLGKIPIIIPHVCNDAGLWGAGFVVAISRSIGPQPEDAYRAWFKGKEYPETIKADDIYIAAPAFNQFGLGITQFVRLKSLKLVVANMVAQYGVRNEDPSKYYRPPIRYGALVDCMRQVAKIALHLKAEIHCPRFGSDLAGGSWDAIKLLILEEWVDKGIEVTEYEFPKRF